MDGLGSLLILALVLVAFYFMAVRPQNKRMQQQRQMQSSIQLGDEVLPAAGLVVTVTSLGEDVITVELSEGVEVRLNRRFIVSKQESEADIAVINGDETGETELKCRPLSASRSAPSGPCSIRSSGTRPFRRTFRWPASSPASSA